jgi:FkbM family methyltransferase
MVDHPAVVAERILPSSVTSLISPIYRRIEYTYYYLMIVLDLNYDTYEIGGRDVEISYTTDAVRQFRGLVESGKIQPEQVPIEYLSASSSVEAFVDVGAHFGTYTVLGSRLNPDAELYAFEPDEYNRSVLREVLRENAISAEVRSEVVAGESGTVTFYIDESAGSESHSLAPDARLDPVEKDCVALSDFFAEAGLSDVFVKIDAEGGEADILADLFSAPISHVEGLVELHPDKLDTDVDDVVERLHTESDECSLLVDSSPEHPHAERIDHAANRPIYYFQYSSPD